MEQHQSSGKGEERGLSLAEWESTPAASGLRGGGREGGDSGVETSANAKLLAGVERQEQRVAQKSSSLEYC